MKFVVVFECRAVADNSHAAPEDLESALELVMDEFYRLDVEDPAIEAELSTGNLRVSLSISAANPVAATNEGSALLRTAIHAAGGATPGWSLVPAGPWGIVMDSLNVQSGVLSPA